jgi:hypothetical protein
VIVNGLIIIAELPFTLTYLYHGFVRDMAICSGWVLVNYTLFMLSISLTAWTSIERYLFIYHEHFIKKHSILLHYFPVGIHIVYTPLFYVALVIFYPCQQAYTPYSYICGGPCYLFQIVPCMIDWGFNVGFVLLITCVVNIMLIISNIRQRDRMKRAIITARNSQQWVKKSRIVFLMINSFLFQRRTMKLSVQLFSISTLCIIGWIPYGVVSIMQIFADTPLLDYILATFFIYFPYVQTLFLPYACLFFMPEIKQKFYNVFSSSWCFKLFCSNNRVHVRNTERFNTLAHYQMSIRPHN